MLWGFCPPPSIKHPFHLFLLPLSILPVNSFHIYYCLQQCVQIHFLLSALSSFQALVLQSIYFGGVCSAPVSSPLFRIIPHLLEYPLKQWEKEASQERGASKTKVRKMPSCTCSSSWLSTLGSFPGVNGAHH